MAKNDEAWRRYPATCADYFSNDPGYDDERPERPAERKTGAKRGRPPKPWTAESLDPRRYWYLVNSYPKEDWGLACQILADLCRRARGVEEPERWLRVGLSREVASRRAAESRKIGEDGVIDPDQERHEIPLGHNEDGLFYSSVGSAESERLDDSA